MPTQYPSFDEMTDEIYNFAHVEETNPRAADILSIIADYLESARPFPGSRIVLEPLARKIYREYVRKG